MDYRLGGSFSELRAVTTNRMLETKEVQAAAVCFGVVSYFTLNINITTTRVNAKFVPLRAHMFNHVCSIFITLCLNIDVD